MQHDSTASFSRRGAWRLGDSLTLAAPVVQAPIGVCGGARLAAAVSRAGGLGCLAAHAPDPLALRRSLCRVRRLTSRPILVAFTAAYEREAVLQVCLEMGVRHFQTFWWNTARLAPCIKQAGGTLFCQVGTVEQADDALEMYADGLVAQGTEAGGQVRSPLPLREFLPRLRERIGSDLPIIAAGGLADRADVERTLALGASAAMLGTRFLLSEEANAHPAHKSRLVRAAAADLTLDARISEDWPCAPRRRLAPPRDKDIPALYAGMGLSKINRVLPAAEIVRRLKPRPSVV